jgi:hypothetical protein
LKRCHLSNLSSVRYHVFVRRWSNPNIKRDGVGIPRYYHATVSNSQQVDRDSAFGAIEMKCSRFLILITGIMYVNSWSAFSADEPTQNAARSAIVRSLPHIAEREQW